MDEVLKLERRQWRYALAALLVAVVCVCAGVTMNLTTVFDENFDHMGIRTFCMFTVISNILAAIALSMGIPYTLDSMHRKDYHIPGWVVVLMLTGTTAVTLTFLVSLFVLAPAKGFVLIFTGSRFLLHGICPLLAIDAFCFFVTDYRIRFAETLYALIPEFLYACLYYVMVVVIGEENGGWNDFYGFATRIRVWIPMVSILPVTFGIAVALRALHNRSFDKRQQQEAELYRKTFAHFEVRDVIRDVARARGGVSAARADSILVPRRLISLLVENSGSNCTTEEGCQIYLEASLESMQSQRRQQRRGKSSKGKERKRESRKRRKPEKK